MKENDYCKLTEEEQLRKLKLHKEREKDELMHSSLDYMTKEERKRDLDERKREATLDQSRPLRHFSTSQLKEELRLRKRGE